MKPQERITSARKFRAILLAKGMTVTDFAARIGHNRNNVAAVISRILIPGKHPRPNTKFAEILAQIEKIMGSNAE